MSCTPETYNTTAKQRLWWYSSFVASRFLLEKLLAQQPLVLNSEIFLLDQCPYQAKEPSTAYYVLINGGRREGFMSFSRALEWKLNANNLIQELNS